MTFFNFTDIEKKYILKSFSNNKIIKNRSIYWYLNDISFIIWIANAQLKIIRRIKKLKAFLYWDCLHFWNFFLGNKGFSQACENLIFKLKLTSNIVRLNEKIAFLMLKVGRNLHKNMFQNNLIPYAAVLNFSVPVAT